MFLLDKTKLIFNKWYLLTKMTHITFSMITNMDYNNLTKHWTPDLVNVVDDHGNTLLMHAFECFMNYINGQPGDEITLYKICKFLIFRDINLKVVNHQGSNVHLMAILIDRYGRQQWNNNFNIITSALVYLIEMKLNMKYSGMDIIEVKNFINMH
jgi:hypothetical protein